MLVTATRGNVAISDIAHRQPRVVRGFRIEQAFSRQVFGAGRSRDLDSLTGKPLGFRSMR